MSYFHFHIFFFFQNLSIFFGDLDGALTSLLLKHFELVAKTAPLTTDHLLLVIHFFQSYFVLRMRKKAQRNMWPMIQQ